MAIGIVTTGNSAGGMIYPVMVQQLLPKLGFAWTTRVIGFLNLALLLVVFAFMRPRYVQCRLVVLTAHESFLPA